MRTRSKIRCSSCKKRIPASEPDVVLRRLDSAECVYFHDRCTGGAMEMVMLEPDVWIMVHRYVDEEAN